MKNRPALLYADADGNIFDWPELEMAGASGGQWKRLAPGDWIPLPQGSDLFLLPSRLPVGFSPHRKRFEVLARDPFNAEKTVQAVAAFMAPAHTLIYSTAYKTLPGAPLLPLFAYGAAGWLDGRFVVAGLRTDEDTRQELCNFDPALIERNARTRMQAESANRLVQHLGKCAISYGCPAARNLFMNRWEAPLPTSPVCNARCLGCISMQDRADLCATQDRIGFVPTPEEICAVAVPHLQRAERAVASFGQGCEGEPLLQAKTIAKSISAMRRATGRGTINLNTNGSLPGEVERLCAAGLDSIRVSMNSARPVFYDRYFRPRGYTFEDVKRSLRTARANGVFTSINYFVLPGFTDQESEWQALSELIEETGLDLIQMRNINIDPEWYLTEMDASRKEKKLGARVLMDRLKDRFPKLRFGYFNPYLGDDPDPAAP